MSSIELTLFGLLLMLTASAALGVRVAYLKGKCDGIAEEMERMAWKPIRTSPNDGTWFLCHQAGTDWIIRISSARWNEGELGGKGWSYCPHSMPQYWMPISEQFTE